MKQKNILQQQLYTVAFVIIAVKHLLDVSALFQRPEWMDLLFLLSFFACIGWKLMLQRYTKGLLAGTLVLGCLFVFISLRMNYFTLIFTFCLLAASQNVNIKNVLKYVSVAKILLLLAHVIPHMITLLITPDQIEYVYRNGVQRQHFYVGHPNTFSMFVGWALLEFTFAFYEQLRGIHLLIIWCINFAVYQFTDSNTSIIVSTICLVLFFAERKKPQLMARVLTPMARYLFLILSVFFVAITALFTSMPSGLREIYLFLNDMFTGRLIFGAYVYETFGIAWFGNPNVYLKNTIYFEGFWLDALVFDNTYIYLFVYYGAVFLILYSIVFIIIGKDDKKDTGRNIEKILIVAYAFYAIMENYTVNAALCFPVLFMGSRLYSVYDERRMKKKEVKNECKG